MTDPIRAIRFLIFAAFRLAVPLAAAFLPAPRTTDAALIMVNSTSQQGPGSGGVCTLGAAILAANTDTAVDGCAAGSGADTINLPAGTYTLTVGNVTPDGPAGLPSVASEITIVGAGAATTIIQRDSGASSFRIFHISSGSLTLAEVMVSGGNAGGGGGIFLSGGALTIEKSILSMNTASLGGAIDNPFCRAITIINSTLSDNLAVSGGAISTNFSPPHSPCFPVVITNSTFSNNRAGGTAGDVGGAIENVGGTLTITNSTISGNTAFGGGGIANISACCVDDPIVGRKTIVATLTLTNSTISGNTAFGGGGIVDHSGTIDLNNVTIANNSADSGGGGISSFDSFIFLKNTIIAGNTDASGQGPECLIIEGPRLGSQGHNLIQDTTGCPIGGDSTGNITGVDAQLGTLADNGGPTLTHALLAGSPAIDAGDPAAPGSGGTACEATDQRGVPRPQGAACDIGAFEFGAIPSVSIPVVEVITVSDAPGVFPPASIPVLEAIRVSDGPTLLPAALITVPEVITVSDAPGVFPPASIPVAETVTVSDVPGVFPPVAISVPEILTVADAPGVFPPASIPVAELISVSDVPEVDPPQAIVVNDVLVANGNTGTTEAVFTVTLSHPTSNLVTVKFDTGDGTAQAGSHYVAKSGALIFNRGETSKTISVTIKGDSKELAGRTFFVHLTKSTNATISRNRGKATIIGDEGADLSLKKSVSPDPAMVGKLLAYTLVVRNDGPGRATGVKVTDNLSSGFSYISANPSAGGCSEGGGTVTCKIPELGKEATTSVTIMVIPTTAGTLTNTARVTGNEGDPNPGNNTATARITVYGPTVVIRPMVAVTNRDEDTVSFIDPETNKVVGSVAIGPKPAGATFLDSLSEGSVPPAKLYVAERGKDGEGGAQEYEQNDDDRGKRRGMVRVLLGPATVSASTAFSFSPGAAIEVGNAPEGLAANLDATQLWVPNPNDDSISIISPARDAAVSTVSLAQPDPTGGQPPEDANGPKVRHGPVAVGFSPDGGFAYVAGRDSNSLMVLDAGRAVTDASNAILDTLEVGHAPVALTMDPEGSLIYVVNRGGNDVAVVDARSPQVPVLHARIPVGKAPEGIALLPDRSKLYVTNSESDAVSVLQVEPGPVFLSLVATIPVGKEPSGIAITRPGSIVNQPFVYVVNRGDNTISVISTVSDQVIATIPVGKSPTGVATVLIPTIP